ncbi:MAG: S8 family serine peptidase [Thermoplasmata archaeon]|nr:MAG: S8 family serine peptidase [Thermoplasmata archaeon]
MVIITENSFFNIKYMVLFTTILCLVALPFGQVMAHPASNNLGKSEPEEKSWWEDWSADTNKNRIDDNLEWFIREENLEEQDLVRVVVDYDHKPAYADEQKLASFGWEIKYVSKYTNSIIVNVTVGEIVHIASWKEVVMIEFAPDGHLALSSALPSIGVPDVWQKLGYDGEDVTIAIIDTGIDDEHQGLDDLDDDPETDDPKVIAFYDAQSHPNQDDGTYEPYDNHGHGTHCAGIAAGTGAPQYTHIGVSPKANLVGIKIGGGSIPYDAAVRGVEWAIANKDKFGIDILSNSWGLYIGGPANQNGNSQLSRLMDEAVNAGLAVFCAAGNTAISLTVYSPADSEKAITVGSVNDEHVLSLFSSQGPTADGRIKPDVCAVGEDVRAPNRNTGNGYVSMSGTSMACPMAAGLAGLMLDANPSLEPDFVKQIMHETSEHNTDARFPVSPNNGYGWGVVEAYGAVKRARDLAMNSIQAPPKVHEGDLISFIVNTTYTRTFYTNKGQDGIRLRGDDELLFVVAIPATWGFPFNISVTSDGLMQYDAYFSMPRFESGMWIIEAEFHYEEDVVIPTEATPKLLFQCFTPDVEFDTTYSMFFNYTLNQINNSKFARNITVDNQDPPLIWIETPIHGDKVSGIVPIAGTALDPDVFDDVERVDIKINDDDWDTAVGTTNWEYEWNTTDFNNGWYSIYAMAFDGEDNSSIITISVELDNFNIQPQAYIDSISPNPANEQVEVSFTGHGSDDDGYITEYEWKSNIQGVLSDTQTFSSSALAVGTHEISFRVKDNDGVWSQMAKLNLRINQIPIAHIDFISPNPATEGDTVTFIGHGTDDRAIMAYNWRSSLDGFLSGLSSFTKILTPGAHDIYFRVQDDDGEWSPEVAQSIFVNRIPEAYIDSISPNPAEEGESVSFEGHGSDDGMIVAYQWTSSLNGTISEIPSFSLINLSLGDHIISFRVMDDYGVWSDYASHDLKIVPVPTAFIDSISPNPANESESITFTGHGTDVGEIINYSWHSDIHGFLSSEASFTTSSLVTGIHNIYFSVENDNHTWSEEVTRQLRINGAPAAFIDSISPNPALSGEEVVFEGHGTDDNEIIDYNWYSSIDGFLSSSPQFYYSQLSSGDHTILFSVQDSDFLWSTEVAFYLRVHRMPVAHIDSISPNPANEGEEVTFIGHGSDDGTIVAYEWISSINGTLGDTPSFWSTALVVGEHEISFRVMDNDGVWSDFTTYSLRINQIPVGIIEFVSPNPANQLETVTFSGSGTDDREITGFSWHSSIDGFLSLQSMFSTYQLSTGQHVITFKVKDDDDMWSEELTINLRINQIPSAYIDSISPSRSNEGEIITFEGRGSDDGNIVAYRWVSSIDGLLSNQNDFSSQGLSVGDHIITFSVMDDDNVWSNEIKRTVSINGIPLAIIDNISPNPALTDLRIHFEGHGVDDGDITDYYWSSSRDGFISGSDSFDWMGLSQGYHDITFKVRDDDDVWSQEIYYYGLVVHIRPIARIIAFTPESPNEGDPVSFVGEGVDDGIIVEYNWTSNIDNLLDIKDEFTTYLSPGTHIITLSVKDNWGVWSRETAITMQVNAIPVAVIDSISPNPAVEEEMVILSGHGDDDGTIAAYQWTSSINGVIGTESSIGLTELSAGNHDISFKVRDNDGVWSQESISSLVISERTNLVPTVILNSPSNYEVFTDEIQIEVEAFDEDGIVMAIEIRVDDNEWIKISDSASGTYTIEITELSDGEHVIYTRAFDGEEYSKEEFVIIRVDLKEEEETYFAGDNVFFISLIVIIILIVAAIILYLLLLGRRRRSPYIRL